MGSPVAGPLGPGAGSHHRIPAAHGQGLARDEAGGIGSEKEHRPRHVLRLADAAQRIGLGDARLHLRRAPRTIDLGRPHGETTELFFGARHGHTGADHVESDAVAAHLARPASEPMLTMAPLLRAIMPSRTARVQLIMPQRLSWTSFSHSARSFSTKSRSRVQPTLLTSTSTRPVRASTSRTVPCTESHFVTSVRATTAEAAPALRASAAVFSPWPVSISAMVTWAPSRAKASEMARPMFDPPPVTMTLLPLRFSSMRRALAVLDVGGRRRHQAVVCPPSR